MDPTITFYDVLIRHNFQRGAVLEELRGRMIIEDAEMQQISTMTYDETQSDVDIIEDALERIKIARANNYYFIKYQNRRPSSGRFADDALFGQARPTLELEVLKLWNSENRDFFSERSIPVGDSYVWFFKQYVAFRLEHDSGSSLIIEEDGYTWENFNNDYFTARQFRDTTMMYVYKSDGQENLWYEYNNRYTKAGFLIYPKEDEDEEGDDFEVLLDEEAEIPPMDCQALVRNAGIYRVHYPVLPPRVIGVNYPDDMIEINDAAYVDEPRTLNSFDEIDQNVLIMAPFEQGQMWRGSYFTKDELRNWATNANHIVHRCEGNQFSYYREDLVAIYYLRLFVGQVTYYIPYIDILEFCRNDNPTRFVLEATDYQITNIVSLSVMITQNAVSSQHCTDSSPKRIYRLRELRI